MEQKSDLGLLDVLLDGWETSNTALVNLLHALPPGGLEARAHATSPTVGAMFSHMHHERLVSVLENVPESGVVTPAREWAHETAPERLAAQLHESAAAVRAAVHRRAVAGAPLDLDFDHPVLLLQFLIFHEGYHHGQIKLALKLSGLPLSDATIGPLVWQRWRARTAR